MMSTCNRIQKIIDEANQPAALPFEATNHIAACAPCRTFADDRARLRALLSAMPRVSAPTYFDARLKARLAEAQVAKASPWFTPAVYLRFGAVSAVLVLAVFAAQYSGLLSLTGGDSGDAPTTVANSFVPTPPVEKVAPTPTIAGANSQQEVSSSTPRGGAQVGRYVSHSRRTPQAVPVRLREEPAGDEMYVPMVILQGNNGSASVPMLPVSVGAQQRMLNRSGGVVAQPIGVTF